MLVLYQKNSYHEFILKISTTINQASKYIMTDSG